MFLTVRPGNPDTSTAPDLVTQRPTDDPFRTLVLAAAGLIGAAGALRRLRGRVATRG